MLARAPVLGIEVIVAATDDLDAVLKNEVLAALRRKQLSTGLMPLAWAQIALAYLIPDAGCESGHNARGCRAIG